MPNIAARAAIPPVLYCCQILLSSSATKCSQSSSEISSAFLPFRIRDDFAVRYDTKCSEALVASLTIEIDAEFEGEDLIKVQRIIKNYFGPKHSKLKELQEASL